MKYWCDYKNRKLVLCFSGAVFSLEISRFRFFGSKLGHFRLCSIMLFCTEIYVYDLKKHTYNVDCNNVYTNITYK